MLKKSFFNRQQTAIVALLRGQSVESLIAQARSAEFDGADGIAIELGQLAPELRTRENFARMMGEVHLPFMFILYRNDGWCGGDDAARQVFLLEAAAAGAEVIDVMGDLFDPSPFELTCKPEAVERQKVLIQEIHERGAKVIMSSHMAEARSAEEVLVHLVQQEARGADMLKIVTVVNTEEEFVEAVRTTLLLNRKLKTPFVHLCNGTFGRLHRFLGPQLGVAIEFAVHDYRPEALFAQPTIRSLKNVMENIHWQVNEFGLEKTTAAF